MMHAGRCSSSHINLNGGKGEKQIGSQWWVSTKWKTNAWWKILSFSRSPVDWRVVKRQLLPTISGVTSEKSFTLTEGHGQRSHTHLRQQVVTGPKLNSVFLKCSTFITATVIILHGATRTNTTLNTSQLLQHSELHSRSSDTSWSLDPSID